MNCGLFPGLRRMTQSNLVGRAPRGRSFDGKDGKDDQRQAGPIHCNILDVVTSLNRVLLFVSFAKPAAEVCARLVLID